MHAMACAAHLAAILISALLMPTLLAASTPCFLNLWLTSPLSTHQACHRARLRCNKPQMSPTAVSKSCSINALAHQQVQKPAEGEH